MKDKIYIDMDGVIINSIKAICDLYDIDFRSHQDYRKVNWSEINTWNFNELHLATNDHINSYFDDDRFFDRVNFMENAFEIISFLSKEYDINIVTMGSEDNLKKKEHWLSYNLPCISEFIGVDLSQYKDKSHINMSNGIFIDDCSNNLQTSNCKLPILYGDTYVWNKDWNGIRLHNWYDIARYLSDR